jgi:hypothetical protein
MEPTNPANGPASGRGRGMRVLLRSLAILVRVVGLGIWCLLGLWTALAFFFIVPLSIWPATVLAAVIAGLDISALRERLFVHGRLGRPWQELRWSTAALAVTTLVAVWYFGFVTPDPNQNWAADHARMPVVKVVGDKVYVGNVRNFTWRTATDFTPAFYDRVYDVSLINSMYYLVVPLRDLDGVAHVFVCFGFSDGQYVAVSVEGRRVEGRPYRVLASMFRQYQLIYVVGDERDVVGKRGAIWKHPVRFYPARSTHERKRALFLDMMERAHSLEEHPEFYHLLTNNCMNNITHHLRRLGGRPLPSDLSLLLTGFSDRLAYDYGYIDTDLPFEKAREAFRIDEWMQQTPLDDQFSRRLRETLARQEAEMASQPDEE